ncbi:MAG: GH116 family glycosyl hydrolase, partial [Melioribacteraceae bacterium]
NDYDGSMNVDEKFDDGCLTDQIIGQWAAHLSGLGYLFDETHIKKSLDSILKLSFKKGKGLRNASWSDKEFLSSIPRNMWVDQGNTYWTGVELAFASFLIYEGKYEQGLDVIKAVDDRYRKAGLYWDHQEFGGHYYRPMSAWAILNAIVGLQINRNTISFSPQIDKENYKLFFATPSGTSHFIRNSGSIIIKQLTGSISFEKLFFSNLSNISFESIVQNQKEISPKIENIKNQTNLIFDSTIFLKSGESIIIN